MPDDSTKSQSTSTFDLKEYYNQISEARNLGYDLRFDSIHSKKHLIIRHDVDLTLESVLDLALLEFENGVTSIYCVMTSNSLYSLEEYKTIRILKAIMELGHGIGLHYNPGPSGKSSFIQQLHDLESVLNIEIKYYSQHQPTIFGFMDLSGQSDLVNLYNLSLNGPYKYISDSCMAPRENFYDLVGAFNKIQYLVHPEFWSLSALNLNDLGEKLVSIYGKEKGPDIWSIIDGMKDSVKRRSELDVVRM